MFSVSKILSNSRSRLFVRNFADKPVEKITVKPPQSLADNPVLPKEKVMGIKTKPLKEGVEKIVVPPPKTLAEDPLLPREEVLGLKINKKLKNQSMMENNEPITDLLEEERDATTPGYITEATKIKVQKMKDRAASSGTQSSVSK